MALRLGEELVPSGEAEGIETVLRVQLDLMRKQQDPRQRGEHFKGHGCVRAEFKVEADIPPAMKIGVFSRPRAFPALIRFSNCVGADDTKPQGHAMALKLLGVEGEKLLEDQKDAQTQDFLLVDYPVFFIRNAIEYAEFFQELLDVLQGSKFMAAHPMIAGSLGMLKFWATHPKETLIFIEACKREPASMLEVPYWSQVPYKLGLNACKYAAQPGPENSVGGKPDKSPDYLHQALVEYLTIKRRAARFDFLVQLQTDPEAMPIEDPTVEWKSEAVKVATITIPPQEFSSPAQVKFAEDLSFNPWHALPEHRPLGGISRTRKAVYLGSSRLRHELNRVPVREPTEQEVRELWK